MEVPTEDPWANCMRREPRLRKTMGSTSNASGKIVQARKLQYVRYVVLLHITYGTLIHVQIDKYELCTKR